MSNEHARYERLAVGHVLGGLDEVDAAAFRSHLLGCRECRLRVSELRGIASDLAAAEREERATATRVATEVERRQQEAPSEPEVATWRSWPWGVVGVAALTAVLVVVLVWNMALRQTNGTLLAATQRQETVLATLATGEELEFTAETGLVGQVAIDDETVALDLADVRRPAPDQGVVVWQLDPAGAVLERSAAVLAGQLEEGRLPMALPRAAGVSSIVLTTEQVPVSVTTPTGVRLLTAEVPATP